MEFKLKGPDIVGYEQVVKVFGLPPADPKELPEWEKDNLVTIGVPFKITMGNPFSKNQIKKFKLSWDAGKQVSRVRVHFLLESAVKETFDYLYNSGLYLKIEDYGGSYMYRPKRGIPGQLSLHAFGIALDINTKQNPLGKPPKMPSELVDAFKKMGWVWGGDWGGKRIDGMHFQWASGC